MKKFSYQVSLLALLITLLGFNAVAQETKTLRSNGQTFKHKPRDREPKPPVDRGVCPDAEFRSIDGTCNNRSIQSRVEFGSTEIPLMRTMLPHYGSSDHYNAMSGEYRKSAREISNLVSNQTTEVKSEADLSSFVFTWGQFLDHDITLTPESHAEYAPIELPANEPLFTSEISFFRSEVHTGTGSGNYREQTNLITAFIDASNVYGSDQDRADWLRTFSDGKLKTSSGNLLPFNTTDGEYTSDIDPSAPSMAGDAGGTAKTYVAGDIRAGEQPGLTSLHTLFVRQHNAICDRLKRDGIRTDEELYQNARKEVGAHMQAITYNEFLPALGLYLGTNSNYNERIQPDISNIFATAAFRLGHTMVTEEMELIDNDCNPVGQGYLTLLEGFFNPDILMTNNIDPILKGLSVQTQNEVDLLIIDNLRNFLFGNPASGSAVGLDLASLNIQRGRDHGIPDYNSIKRRYTGRAVRSFSDISNDPNVVSALEEAFEDVNEIDAWVGLLSEDKIRDAQVGPTLVALLTDQFERLRDGDRYFFTNDRMISRNDQQRINNTTLSEIIVDNTTLTDLQSNVFKAELCPTTITNKNGTRSLENTDDIAIGIFPNPTNGVVNINLEETPHKEGTIKLVDNLGRYIWSGILLDKSQSIDLSKVAPGQYNLIIEVNGIRSHEPLIILD